MYNGNTSLKEKGRNAIARKRTIGMFMTRRIVEIGRRSGKANIDRSRHLLQREGAIRGAWGNVAVGIERKMQRLAYLRPNLLYTWKFVIVHLLFGFPRRSNGPAGTNTVNVLLFLLRRLQDLQTSR